MIKLTPRGCRFGDVMREILKDSTHIVTISVRNWRSWSYLEKKNPQRFQLKLKYNDLIGIDRKDGWVTRFGVIDMSLYWNEVTRKGLK